MKTFIVLLLSLFVTECNARVYMLHLHNNSSTACVVTIENDTDYVLAVVTIPAGKKLVQRINSPDYGIELNTPYTIAGMPDLHEDFDYDRVFNVAWFLSDGSSGLPDTVNYYYMNPNDRVQNANLSWFGVEMQEIEAELVRTKDYEETLRLPSVLYGMTVALGICGAWVGLWSVLRGLNPTLPHS